MVFGLGLSMLFAAEAEPYSRESVQAAILHSLDEVEKAREETIRVLEKTVKAVEEARAKRGVVRSEHSVTKIVETEALSKIAESTANVELAKIHAHVTIAKAVDTVELLAHSSSDPDQEKAVRHRAMKEIASAIAAVEVAKAKAKKTIIEVTGEVELSKTMPGYKSNIDAAALTVARKRAVDDMMKAVSRVEAAREDSFAVLKQSSSAVVNRQEQQKDVSDTTEIETVNHVTNGSVTLDRMLPKSAYPKKLIYFK